MFNKLDKLMKLFKGKIVYLFMFIITFTLIYTLLEDKHFSGENKVQDIVKDEVIKQKVGTTTNVDINKQSFVNKEGFINVENPGLLFGLGNGNNNNNNDNNNDNNNNNEQTPQDRIETDYAIQKTTEDTKDDLKDVELDATQIEPNIFQRFFNRLYFSVITGCLIGYGDISPNTNLCKFITMIQSLSTIALIIY